MADRRPDAESLLAEGRWVRALARSLTRRDDADDLAQEALATAIVHAPPAGISLRRWLGGVLRNLARHARRTNARRVAREQVVARHASEGSEQRSLEHFELHRLVVDAVSRLEDPYRATILLRYFEGLSPTAIARRSGTPLRTVHTRLHRALARLRTDLDRRHGGDRAAWLLPLVPFAAGSSGTTNAAIGASLVNWKVLPPVLALAIVGISYYVVAWRGPEATRRLAAPAVASAPVAPPRADAAPILREQAEATVATAAQSASAEALSARVLDTAGEPVPGLRLRITRAGAPIGAREVEVDAAGRFTIPPPWDELRVEIATAGWTSVLEPSLPRASAAGETLWIVGRAVSIGGVVVDERGQTLGSANVAMPTPPGLRARFSAILDDCRAIECSTTTRSDGSFSLVSVPVVEGATIVTTCAPFVSDERALPPHGDESLVVVLRDAGSGAERLIGIVVDAAGAPVEGAWVGLGGTATKSGPRGVFALPIEPNDAARTILRGVKVGYHPAEVMRGGGAWPSPLVLRLGSAALAIAGTVVGSNGAPVPRAEVWLADETRFGTIAIEGGEMNASASATVEGIVRGDPWAGRVRADSSGSFRITGLAARDYRVHALDRAHLLVAASTCAAGSEHVVLRLQDEPRVARIAGQVVDHGGSALAGVPVFVQRARDAIAPGPLPLASFVVKTDAEGRFAFADMAAAAAALGVRGEVIGRIDVELPLLPMVDSTRLRIVVPARVHIQVEAAATQPDFERVAVLDADGNSLELTIRHGDSSYTSREVVLHEGRTEPFVVADLGVTLVLRHNGTEVRRVPVQLVADRLNTVRL